MELVHNREPETLYKCIKSYTFCMRCIVNRHTLARSGDHGDVRPSDTRVCSAFADTNLDQMVAWRA